MSDTLKPWRTLDRRPLFHTPRISVFVETVQLPDGRVIDDYEQFEMSSFALVFAQNTNGLVVCERQYKHGLRGVTLTFPGGQIDEGEAPLDAARRELLEETGYGGGQWRSLGSYSSHANQGGATVHYFHATGCHLLQPAASGDLEEIRIELLSPERMLEAVLAGEFQVIADLSLAMLAITHRPGAAVPLAECLDPSGEVTDA